jgi:hypothetical protein
MKKQLMSGLICGVAIATLPGSVPLALAGQNGADTISIKFAADEPTQGAGSMLAATDVTGVVPSANWNNATTNTGVAASLLEDVNGVATPSSAQVTWFASNTWSSTGKGQENNNFKGADHTLMSGYLDMETAPPPTLFGTTFIQVSNLPVSFSGTYDVYIYALGGFPGAGGVYEVNGNQNRTNLALCPRCNYQYFVTSGIQDPTKAGTQGLYSGPDFFQSFGDDSAYGADDYGNYMVFMGLSGPTVNITAVAQQMPTLTGYTNTGYPRAPINGIQIVVD